jgi:hypothetical protein
MDLLLWRQLSSDAGRRDAKREATTEEYTQKLSLCLIKL